MVFLNSNGIETKRFSNFNTFGEGFPFIFCLCYRKLFASFFHLSKYFELYIIHFISFWNQIFEK